MLKYKNTSVKRTKKERNIKAENKGDTQILFIIIDIIIINN